MPLFGPPDVEKMLAKRDVKGLISALKYKDANISKAAAKALGDIADPHATGPLIASLNYHWSGMDEIVIEAQVKIGKPAVDLLVSALKDSDWQVRRNCAKALGQIRDMRAIEPLAALLVDEDSSVRRYSAEALGEISDPRAIEPLVAALKDKSFDAREAVAGALEKIGWQPGKDENGARYWIGKHEWSQCVGFGSLAVEPLIAVVMYDYNYWVRGAAEALGDIGDPRAVEALVAAVSHANQRLLEMHYPAFEPIVTAIKNGTYDASKIKHKSAADAQNFEYVMKVLQRHVEERDAAAEALKKVLAKLDNGQVAAAVHAATGP